MHRRTQNRGFIDLQSNSTISMTRGIVKPCGVGNRATGHGDPREPLGPDKFPMPVLSPRQACDDTRSCGNQPAYGSLSDCRRTLPGSPDHRISIQKACGDAGIKTLRLTIDKRHGKAHCRVRFNVFLAVATLVSHCSRFEINVIPYDSSSPRGV